MEERTRLLREATQFASNPYLALNALPDTDAETTRADSSDSGNSQQGPALTPQSAVSRARKKRLSQPYLETSTAIGCCAANQNVTEAGERKKRERKRQARPYAARPADHVNAPRPGVQDFREEDAGYLKSCRRRESKYKQTTDCVQQSSF
ncbi:hypothetical protein NDU88_004479 [Pleurodeles waltl]|uniref:Uncharacterized protein n=1 Tax=Pleurodeles waltl TaxID=8319 RepID=A0AAV7WVM6_PLEWA|nr:hypothetical protein NDU88_004479 [Pleurodeles waltl]